MRYRGCDALFDHLVGAREHRDRYIEAERPRGFQVYDQLVFVSQLSRQIGWLLTHEHTVDVGVSALVELDIVHGVGCQTVGLRHITERMNSRHPLSILK